MTTTGRAGLRRNEDDAARQLDAELAALFDQHADFVWRVLKRLGTPAAELEDALQEVFLVVARKLPEYEERGGMRAWLFAIARQVASHALRASRRRERREREPPEPPAAEDPHRALERSEAVRFVEQFLTRLDEAQAEVFFLAEIEGMTAPEIAACLGVGLNTVYSRLRLARERFERALSRHSDRSQP
jgi:RNA polymerase sigma-70 factor (ECF subfamily)